MLKKIIVFKKQFFIIVCLCAAHAIGCKENSSPIDPGNGEKDYNKIAIKWQMTNGPCGGNIKAAAFQPGGYMYTGGSDLGVFRSADNGNSWQEVNNGLGNLNLWCLCINDQGHVFAGIGSDLFRSTDNGFTWTRINEMEVSKIVVNSLGHLFIATRFGEVFRSTNGGSSWQNRNPNAPLVRFIGINADDHVFLGTIDDGIFRSTNNGDSWLLVGVPATHISGLAIDEDDRIYAINNDIARSENNGDKWTRLDHGIEDADFTCVVVNSEEHVFAGGSNGIYRSTDHGDNWTIITDISVMSLVINSKDHLFAGGGWWNQGVYRSINSGENWQLNGLENVSVMSFTIDSQDHIFAVGIRSSINGESWSGIGLADKYLTSVAVDSRGFIYVGTDGGDLFYSEDNGQNWTATSFDGYNVSCLIVDINDYLFACRLAGVYYSTNNGNDWVSVNNGFTSTNVEELAFNSENTIFAGTNGRGVYRGVISEVTE